MTDIQDIYLHAGAHKPGQREGCVMEWVSVKWLMQHGWTLDDAWGQLTDSPKCTERMIYGTAQKVNDLLSDDQRQRLVPLVDRLARAHTPADPVKAKRCRVRVSCWAARSVLDLIVDDERRAVALRSIETAEAWLRGEASQSDCRAAYAAAGAAAAAAAYAYAAAAAGAAAAAYAGAAAAAYAAAAAAAAADAYAYAYADAYAAAYAARDLVLWLDELLDQWEKAVSEEGCALDEPPLPTQAGGS